MMAVARGASGSWGRRQERDRDDQRVAQAKRVDLVRLIGADVKLTRRGKDFTGICPFHKEKTGSFNVVPEKGFYHCFGFGACLYV